MDAQQYNKELGGTLGTIYGFGSPVGTNVGKKVGNAIGGTVSSLGKAAGLGTKTRTWSDAAGWAPDVAQVSQDQYNRYGDLKDLYNQNRSQDQWAQGDALTGTKTVKKSSKFKGSSKKYFTEYGLGESEGNTAGDYALNQYRNYLLGDGTQGAQDWLSSQGTAYANSMGEGNTALRRSYSDALDAMINQGVTDRDAAAFEEAKAKLDAQKAYGYLSDTGYANALAKLQGQTATNQNAMRQAGVGAQSNYLTDYDQRYAQIENNPWDWAQYQNDYTKDQDWLDFTKYAEQNALSQDYLNSLMDAANQYSPDEWIAYGAGTQGQYNPYEDFTSGNRKRKKNYNTNINEV